MCVPMNQITEIPLSQYKIVVSIQRRGLLLLLSCFSLGNLIYITWCHCHPIISHSSKIHNGLHFWCRLTYVVPEKGR